MPTVRRQGRRNVNTRMSWTAVGVIDDLARTEDVREADGRPNRSEMIRILLAFALRHWKRGWRP
ncbi:hypothetical protein [Plantactinospora sp. WMMB782]|uniref:hypothetical protein n=1 Tax=Plantactinospora sp. WMMB782 TaxID=3404121 RepID=UPI003B959D3F